MAKKLIYLASPYTARPRGIWSIRPLSFVYAWFIRRQRFNAVCAAAAKIKRSGVMVCSPIAHTHVIAAHGELPKDFEFWREFAERMIATCDALWVLMLDGWEESAGTRAEVAFAQGIGKPVAAVDPELPTLPIVLVYQDAR